MIYNPLSPPPAPPPTSGTNYSAEHGCFEGPEKLLEIWFSPAPFAKPTTITTTTTTTTTTASVDTGSRTLATTTAAAATAASLDALDSDLSDMSSPPTPNNEVYCDSNLRSVKKPIWDAMLATVKCTVLNVIHNAHVDAYLLSESSMFVYPHKVIIKTCGTTTLLHALPGIMNIAKTHCGLDSVYRLFYSRKSFMFPEKQPDPHRSWENEVKYLDSYFDNGAAYIIGDTNADEWYLYLTSPSVTFLQHHASFDGVYQQELLKQADEDFNWLGNEECTWTRIHHHHHEDRAAITHDDDNVSASNNDYDDEGDDRSEDHSVDYFSGFKQQLSRHDYRTHDETIEILMTGLDPRAMEAFYQQGDEPTGIPGGRRVDLQTGLDKLYPTAKVDSFLFEPCGYSANGLLGDGYYTIHVTPEPQCSYASFETTIPTLPISHPGKSSKGQHVDAIRLLVRQVIDIFQPSNFTVTYFASHRQALYETETSDIFDKDEKDTGADVDVHQIGCMMGTLDMYSGYRRKNKILHVFDGYDLVFGHYTKI